MEQIGAESQNITLMLRQWSSGQTEVLDELLPAVYAELHRQARRYMRRERREHTLQTTALINEAYLKLIDQGDKQWESRTHFFAVAAQAMRQVLVDYARVKNRKKRGGDAIRLTLDEVLPGAAGDAPTVETVDLIALDTALERLGEIDAQQVRIVELRYFSGLTLEETAEALQISRATVAREWNFARAWLRRELQT